MADFPSGVYSPRTKENKPGIEYDSAKTTIGYAEDVTKLDDEVDKLPPEFKAVFVLRMHEELSYEDIAGRLGIEIGTVMSRLYRARTRLKKALEEYL